MLGKVEVLSEKLQNSFSKSSFWLTVNMDRSMNFHSNKMEILQSIWKFDVVEFNLVIEYNKRVLGLWVDVRGMSTIGWEHWSLSPYTTSSMVMPAPQKFWNHQCNISRPIRQGPVLIQPLIQGHQTYHYNTYNRHQKCLLDLRKLPVIGTGSQALNIPAIRNSHKIKNTRI